MPRLADSARSVAQLLIVTVLCFAAAAVPARAQKPKLSAEIERVLSAEGIAAARARFAEIYPEQKEAWQVDLENLTRIGMARMEKGDMEAATAVIEMANRVQIDQLAAALTGSSPEMAQIDQAMRKAAAETAAPTAGNAAGGGLERAPRGPASAGPARDDLGQFAGLYGDPADGGQRNLFVTVSCDGYLVAGPMWADVPAWWMRSESERLFTYADSFTHLRLEFAPGDDGRAKSVAHDLDAVASPLSRLGELPADWPACVERPRR